MAILVGGLGGAVSFWLVQENDARKFSRLKENALCVLDLPEESLSVGATFTIPRSIDKFQVGIQTRAAGAPLSISISGDGGLVGSATMVKTATFGLGREIRPGVYTATLRRENIGTAAAAVICGELPVHVTGWQIWHRTYLGLLALSAVGVLIFRNSRYVKRRTAVLGSFHALLLGFVLVFIYLLLHEGGHALAQIAFGHFDLAQSDFWGIRGHPHSGGGMGPPLQPWQHKVISCAGPMLPTLTGFALFAAWALPIGRRIRGVRPMVNLYFSAIVAILVISEAVMGPAYLLGIATAEGDLIGYVASIGGPVWLLKGLLWGMALASIMILWRVIPQIRQGWERIQSGWIDVPPAAVPPPTE